MDVFYNLINQIVSLPEDSTEEFLNNYDLFLETMLSNQELINDVKKQMQLQGMNSDDIVQEKELLLVSINRASEEVNLTDKQKELLKKLGDIIYEIYNKVLEQGLRPCVTIPFGLCREDAKAPTYAHPYDAGFDIYLPEDFTIKAHEYGKIAPTGLKMAIPSGYELQIRPRSGNSVKTTLRIANAPGTIDCGYANEIGIICDNIGDEDLEFKKGDRIAQGIIAVSPKGIFNQVDDIMKVTGANRGGGYGSTGK